MDNPLYHYFVGGVVGISQTLVGHPLDTLKTIRQNSNTKIGSGNIDEKKNAGIKIKNFRDLYRGVRYPLYISSAFNFGVFGILNTVQKHTHNYYVSGFITGGVMAIPLSPFELYKVRYQVNIKNNTGINPFLGTKLTMMRESIGSSVYFGSYFWMKENTQIPTFLSGGISGFSSWLFTYPIDTIRNRYMIKPENGLKEIIRITMLQKGLWNGFSLCAARSFLVNGVGFMVYEFLHNYESTS